MKKGFLTIILISLLNCNSKIKTNGNNFLLGKWTMIEFSNTLCNYCPKVEFNSNHAGKIYTADEEISFTYSLNEDNKTIEFSGSKYFFTDKEYHYSTTLNENRIYLELSSKSGETYTLTKYKKINE